MGAGGNLFGFSEMLKFGEKVSNIDFDKVGKNATGYVRELQAKAAYNRTLQTFDAETAEAVAAAVRAGRDPRAILERAERQRRDRTERERLLAAPPPLHGSARWAAVSDFGPLLRGREVFDDPRSILLGSIADDRNRLAGFLHWDDDGHLLTVAPMRTGTRHRRTAPAPDPGRGAPCRACPLCLPDLRETAPTPEVNSRRRDRCEAALCLHGEGLPTKEIARRIGASRNAVRRWVRAGRFVPYRRAPGSSRLDRHLPFVMARRQEGQHSATVLHRELRAQGFPGGYDIVRRWVARRRQGAMARPPSARIPSTRRITRWLTSDPAALSREDRDFTEALCIAAPKLRQAAEDVRAFADLLRQEDPAGLTPWLEAAAATDLGGFVTGLRQDEAAVRAAIVEPWSNGPVEGQVNRLKLIKRSMYGRAGFDLLRQRVLHAARAETGRA